MFPSGRRVVHRFQSGEEEYIEAGHTTTTTLLTPAAKKQGGGNTQLDTILLQADRLPSILQVSIVVDLVPFFRSLDPGWVKIRDP